MTELVIDTPRKLVPALEPSRYVALYGGRGSGKSHFFAEKLIDRCLSQRTRWACIREVQGTLRDSVRQLLIDKIAKFKVEHLFEVLESEIRGVPGTQTDGCLIIFKGMQSYNAANIKSLEDFDGAWVEEAQTLSDVSLRMLRPTIRKHGSELWFSWNPRYETDPVDKFFRGANPPEDAIIINVNWWDNPWFNDVMKKERDADYANDPEMAEHVWGGGYELVTEANYYAKAIAEAERSGRVGHFPYNPSYPVITSWDIGVDDYTAIWFWQEDGVKAWAIDYYEVSGDGAQQIVETALPELNPDDIKRDEALRLLGREVPFVYGKHFLPHDVMNREWGSGAKSRFQTLGSLGVKPIKVGARQGPEERINAMRDLFPLLRFNATDRVKTGLMHLRRYSRKRNEQLGIYTGVLHDEHSHGADAAGEFAVNCSIRPAKPEDKPQPKELTYTANPDGSIVGNMSVKAAVAAMKRRRMG